MEETYFINPQRFTLEKFKNILKSKDILPGRIILKECPDQRFEVLNKRGLKTLYDLLKALNSKEKINEFSELTGLSVEYLTILRREAKSYLSVPVRLKEMAYWEPDVIAKLESVGIRDSRQLFNAAYRKKDREELSVSLGISSAQLTELVRLCDLVRITGVGPLFARIMYDAGIFSVRRFLSGEKDKIYEELVKINDEKGYTKAKFTFKDMEYCRELGKHLPLVLEE